MKKDTNTSTPQQVPLEELPADVRALFELLTDIYIENILLSE